MADERDPDLGEDPRQKGTGDQMPGEAPEQQGGGEGRDEGDGPPAPGTSSPGESGPGTATGNPGAAGS
jgi:hypothetical protein